MPPFECNQAPFTVLSPAFQVYPVRQGTVRLIHDDESFRRSFARFNQGTRTGYSPQKHERRGQTADVIEVYDDLTVTIQFSDGETLDFPFETVAEQITVVEMPPYRVDPVQLGRVRLLTDPDEFIRSFARFQGDPLDGFSEAKFERLGQIGNVVQVFDDDDTITVRFEDGQEFNVPFETVEEQVSVDDSDTQNEPIPRRRSRLSLFSTSLSLRFR